MAPSKLGRSLKGNSHFRPGGDLPTENRFRSAALTLAALGLTNTQSVDYSFLWKK